MASVATWRLGLGTAAVWAALVSCTTPKLAAKVKPDAEVLVEDEVEAAPTGSATSGSKGSAKGKAANPPVRAVVAVPPGVSSGTTAARAAPVGTAGATGATAAPTPTTAANTAIPLKPLAASAAPKSAQNCRDLLTHFTPIYRSLFAQLPVGSYAKTGTTVEQLTFAEPFQCNETLQRKVLMQAAIDAVNNHSGRVGLILPLTGPYAKQATFVVNGLRAAFAENGASFDKAVVLKDSGGLTNGVVQRLAELVFKDRVAMVIGGFEREAAVTLVQWSDKLLLPVLIMHRERELSNPSKYAYTVYPDEERLASTLAAASRQRNFKRIALLKPDSGRADKITAYFKAAVLASGGQVPTELTYTSNNFESMQAAAKTLLHTGTNGREKEYREAYKEAKEAAQAEGVPFNAKLVVLKPVVDIDAVFIPDDFRSVRYFAKIFKFNQVDKIPLIGNHEWRSPALIEPYDDFLTGSIFGDFIGNYNKLPPAVSAKALATSPFFVEPQMAQVVDFQLVGYRAGRIAKTVLAQPALNRRGIPKIMTQITGDQAGLPIGGTVFDKDRHCYWPTYVFSVAPHELRLEHSQTNGAAAAVSALRTPSGTRTCANANGAGCLSATAPGAAAAKR